MNEACVYGMWERGHGCLDLCRNGLLSHLPSTTRLTCVHASTTSQVTDVEIDRINKPYLPIAAGQLSRVRTHMYTGRWTVRVYRVYVRMVLVPTYARTCTRTFAHARPHTGRRLPGGGRLFDCWAGHRAAPLPLRLAGAAVGAAEVRALHDILRRRKEEERKL